MKKTSILSAGLISLSVALTLGFSACGVSVDTNPAYSTGDSASTQQAFSDFSEIEISTNAEVILTQDASYNVSIEGEKKVTDKIKIKQEGDRLIIEDKSTSGSIFSFSTGHEGKVKIYISLPVLSNLEVSGAAKIRTSNAFKQSQALSFDFSGASDAKIEVDVPELRIESSGASNLSLTGKTASLSLNQSGAGSVDAFNLEADSVSLDLSGASSVSVNAKAALNVELSGLGSVKYKGNPTLTQNISGAGSIKKVE